MSVRPRVTTPSTSRAIELEVKERAKKAKNLADFIKQLTGEHIVISSKNGVIYEGILVDKDHGFLILKDAVVRGSKYTAKVSFLLVKSDVVQHIHSKPLELVENSQQQ